MKRVRMRIDKFIEVYTTKDCEALRKFDICFWDTRPIDSTKTMNKTKNKNVRYIFMLSQENIEMIFEELLKRI